MPFLPQKEAVLCSRDKLKAKVFLSFEEQKFKLLFAVNFECKYIKCGVFPRLVSLENSKVSRARRVCSIKSRE
jgi:hypothetical protein